MKTRLTLTVAALLLAAMLLVNLALLALWKRDILQREAAHDQAVLIHIAYRRRAEKARPQEYVAELPHGGLTAVLLQDEYRAADMPPLLADAAAEAMRTGEAAVCSAAFFAELLRGRQPFLASALPLRQDGQVIGAAAMIRPLPQLYVPLWQAEKIVLIYIVLNLLALAAVFFFRLNSLVVRPIERLAGLAGQHSGGGAVWFAADSDGSEFNRLAGSLNWMLTRIEDDRAMLQKTVAELEAANRQLHERQAELIRAEKLAAAGRLAAGLAHEIGNPLAVIQGYLDLLARSGQNKENSDFIRRAAQETQRVTRLIRQLLDCTRVSKGKPEDIALHELLAEVAELVQVQKAFCQIKLTMQAEAAQDTVHADPDQLRQVLLNCLLNSADAIGSAGRTDGAITLATDQPEQGILRLRIEDNGSGVLTEHLAAVFDPFFTTKEPGRGTGLGLSVSRSIVESVGGFMTMESRAGQGSTVIICLPLAKGGGGNG